MCQLNSWMFQTPFHIIRCSIGYIMQAQCSLPLVLEIECCWNTDKVGPASSSQWDKKLIQCTRDPMMAKPQLFLTWPVTELSCMSSLVESPSVLLLLCASDVIVRT